MNEFYSNHHPPQSYEYELKSTYSQSSNILRTFTIICLSTIERAKSTLLVNKLKNFNQFR